MRTSNCITYYYLGSVTVECIVSEDNIKIRNSYLVKDDENKKEVIEYLLKTFPWFKESRTDKDILKEWKAHNILFKWKLFKDRTIDTDIEINQSIFKKTAYALLSLFKE